MRWRLFLILFAGLAAAQGLSFGVLFLGERLTGTELVTFACIWTGLLLYAVDGVRAARTPVPLPQ